MGQRLAVIIEHEGNPIAAVYYHWSAYTFSALNIAYDLIDAWDSCSDRDPWQNKLLNVIHFIRDNRGGLDKAVNGREFKAAQEMYPGEVFPMEGYSRNNGLIALTPEGISSIISAAEGEIILNMDDREIFNTVVNVWESKEELMEAYDGYSEAEIDNAVSIDLDLSHMRFMDLPKVMDIILNYPEEHLFVHEGLIFETIQW